MGIRKYNPTTPGLRGMTVSTFEEITTSTPEKSLTVTLKKHAGRNNRGKITVRHQGGGTRPKYRIIDFKRTKDDIPATVKTIEYDPNRSANIALLVYADGEKRYILAPKGLQVGQQIVSGPEADIVVGNALPIANIPVGTIIHNVELKPGKGGGRKLYGHIAVKEIPVSIVKCCGNAFEYVAEVIINLKPAVMIFQKLIAGLGFCARKIVPIFDFRHVLINNIVKALFDAFI